MNKISICLEYIWLDNEKNFRSKIKVWNYTKESKLLEKIMKYYQNGLMMVHPQIRQMVMTQRLC